MGYKMYKENEAVSVYNGVITIIGDDGELEYYKQRGIDLLSKEELEEAIEEGELVDWINELVELPKNYKLYYEDSEIMGNKVDVAYKK